MSERPVCNNKDIAAWRYINPCTYIGLPTL